MAGEPKPNPPEDDDLSAPPVQAMDPAIQELMRENQKLKDLLQNILQALSRGYSRPPCPNPTQLEAGPMINLPATGEGLGLARPVIDNVCTPSIELH